MQCKVRERFGRGIGKEGLGSRGERMVGRKVEEGVWGRRRVEEGGGGRRGSRGGRIGGDGGWKNGCGRRDGEVGKEGLRRREGDGDEDVGSKVGGTRLLLNANALPQ